MENTKIEWCNMTFNPWIGCTKVSPGCANCYAEELMDKRYGRVNWGKGNPRSRTSETYWKEPLRWNRNIETSIDDALHDFGEDKYIPPHRPRVFCASLSDWLDTEVTVEWLADLLDLIRRTPCLDWLLLTKRPEMWRDRIYSAWCHMDDTGNSTEDWLFNWWALKKPPRNVWIGTSVEDEPRADERIPHLLNIPARVRFLSCEPLLSEVGFLKTIVDKVANPSTKLIHWVIAGGESGPKARPMEADWARSLRDQCNASGIAFFMKQMGGVRDKRGEISDLPEDLRIREFPEEVQSDE